MIGIEYLWGGPVKLETSEVISRFDKEGLGFVTLQAISPTEERRQGEIKWQRVVYTMKDRKLSKKVM